MYCGVRFSDYREGDPPDGQAKEKQMGDSGGYFKSSGSGSTMPDTPGIYGQRDAEAGTFGLRDSGSFYGRGNSRSGSYKAGSYYRDDRWNDQNQGDRASAWENRYRQNSYEGPGEQKKRSRGRSFENADMDTDMEEEEHSGRLRIVRSVLIFALIGGCAFFGFTHLLNSISSMEKLNLGHRPGTSSLTTSRTQSESNPPEKMETGGTETPSETAGQPDSESQEGAAGQMPDHTAETAAFHESEEMGPDIEVTLPAKTEKQTDPPGSEMPAEDHPDIEILAGSSPASEAPDGSSLATEAPERASIDTETPVDSLSITEAPQSGHRYELVVGDFSWESAKESAEASGGYLATIDSAEEQEKIEAILSEHPEIHVVWIGGYLFNGSFIWLDGKPLSSSEFQRWGYGEPNNETGDENYLDMYRINGVWYWNDVPNDISSYYAGHMGYVKESI